MKLRAPLSFVGTALLVALATACSAPLADAPDTTNDSDLTQAPAAETAAAKLVALTPIENPVRGDGWLGKELRGTGEKGKACTVHVFHFDHGAVEIVVNDDGETSDMILAAGLRPSDLDGWRADANSVHFEDWWIEDQAKRNHEVDVKRFGAPGSGVSMRTKKLGFDKVVQCSNLVPTETLVTRPEHSGE